MRALPPLALALGLAGVLAPGALDAADTALLPEVSMRIQAARYAPSEREFKWNGWIGAGVGLIRVDGVTLFGTADVETIIGSEKRTFDANQANYHLDAGLRHAVGDGGVALVFHHVSRHYVDRPKTLAVDWNVLSVGAHGRLPAGVPGRFTFGIGRTTQASLPAYQWDATMGVEVDVLKRSWGDAYAAADGRLVTRRPSPLFPEDHFVDVGVEAGLRFTRGARTMRAFAAYEHRNDVYLEEPGIKDRALIGLRIGFGQGGSEPRATSASWP